MLKLCPINLRARVVRARTAGTTTMATTVTPTLRRKTSSTSAASTAPMAMASARPRAEAVISSLWSYHGADFTPAGAVRRASANTLVTSLTIRTVSPLGCW